MIGKLFLFSCLVFLGSTASATERKSSALVIHNDVSLKPQVGSEWKSAWFFFSSRQPGEPIESPESFDSSGCDLLVHGKADKLPAGIYEVSGDFVKAPDFFSSRYHRTIESQIERVDTERDSKFVGQFSVVVQCRKHGLFSNPLSNSAISKIMSGSVTLLSE